MVVNLGRRRLDLPQLVAPTLLAHAVLEPSAAVPAPLVAHSPSLQDPLLEVGGLLAYAACAGAGGIAAFAFVPGLSVVHRPPLSEDFVPYSSTVLFVQDGANGDFYQHASGQGEALSQDTHRGHLPPKHLL